MVCFAAIGIVLGVYEGHDVPQLPADITLNAVVAILSTVGKSLLIYSVSAAIGQSKWDWYDDGRQRNLEDLETLDEASRGPLGAVKMLVGPTYRSIGSIGAVVVILSLAVDSFVQQVVDSAADHRFVESGEAWVEKVTGPTFLPQANSTDEDYLNAVSGAVWNDASMYDRPVHCPSGNCTFSSYRTLEWCADAHVVEDPGRLETDCSIAFNKSDFEAPYKLYTTGTGGALTQSRGCTVYMGPNKSSPLTSPIVFSLLPTGNGLPAATNPGYGEPSFITTFPTTIIAPMYIGGPGNKTVVGVANPVLAMGYARFVVDRGADGKSTPQRMKLERAEYSVLTLCDVRRTVSVVDGIANSSVKMSTYGTLYPDDTTPLGKGALCWRPSEDAESDNAMGPPQSLDGVPFIGNASSMSFCASTFDWGAHISARLSSRDMAKKTQAVLPNGRQDEWETFWEQGAKKTSQDVFEQIGTKGLGKVMHSMSEALNQLMRARSQDRATGGFDSYERILQVRWWWLVLPVAFEVLGVGFLLAIVCRKRRAAGLWKDSLLAVLYHGLEDDHGTSVGMETLSEMSSAAKMTQAKLQPREEGGRVGLGFRD